MRIINRYINQILYGLVILGTAVIIFMLFIINIKTDRNVEDIHQDLLELQRQIEKDHDRQDEAISCIASLFTLSPSVSEEQVNECVRKANAYRLNEGTGLVNPASTHQSTASYYQSPLLKNTNYSEFSQRNYLLRKGE